MIYRSGVFNRKPGLDEAAFRHHWQFVHGPLAAKLPGLGTYRQNHIVKRLFEADDSPVQTIDGISQLSFESVAHMVRSDASAEYSLCKQDIPKFQGGITILVLSSDEIFSKGPKGGVKLLWVSTARSMPLDEGARRRWISKSKLDEWAQLPGIRGFTQNFVIDRSHPVAAGVPSGDAAGAEALSEIWFDDEDKARSAHASDIGQRLIYADESLRTVGTYLIEEVRIA
jgi:uncharacterized protein (TIGR02118 family)